MISLENPIKFGFPWRIAIKEAGFLNECKFFAEKVRCVMTPKRMGWILSIAVFAAYLVKVKCQYLKRTRYPCVKDETTIQYFLKSKTIIVEDNVYVRRKIKEIYGDAAAFCSAKEKSLFREIENYCVEGKHIIVVNRHMLCLDLVNGTCHDEPLDRIAKLAETLKYVLFVADPEEEGVPRYTGWLLNEEDSTNLLTLAKKSLQELLTSVPQFAEDFKKFSGQATVKDMLSYYKLAVSNANGLLHCTAKYLGNGSARSSAEYWKNSVIKKNLSRCYSLEVIGFVWTPRTFGARVKLTSNQLRLWDNIDESQRSELGVDEVFDCFGAIAEEKEPDFTPVKGRGSRAHLTIGVAEDIPAVQTGQDLLEVVRLEAEHRDRPTYRCSWGWLRDYGMGIWVLYGSQNYSVESMFGGVYNR